MQAAAHNGKYDIVRQAGMDLVKIHHDLENEKQPRPIVQKPAPPLNYQQSPPSPLTPSPLAQNPASPLNYHQLPLLRMVVSMSYMPLPPLCWAAVPCEGAKARLLEL